MPNRVPRRQVLAILVVSLAVAGSPARGDRSSLGKPIRLFDGRSLTGWAAVFEEPEAKAGDVWRVDRGELVCTGSPHGYLRTTADYTNYVLRLRWRFVPPVPKDGGSGVLLRVVGPDKVWPRMIEAQVQPGETGDFWVVDGARLTTPKSAQGYHEGPYDQRVRFRSNERPLGAWNDYEIVCDGGHITLTVNGEVVNEGFDAEEVPGKIALESEGAEIHFRDVVLVPIARATKTDRR
jgi:hypothetical protein